MYYFCSKLSSFILVSILLLVFLFWFWSFNYWLDKTDAYIQLVRYLFLNLVLANILRKRSCIRNPVFCNKYSEKWIHIRIYVKYSLILWLLLINLYLHSCLFKNLKSSLSNVTPLDVYTYVEFTCVIV